MFLCVHKGFALDVQFFLFRDCTLDEQLHGTCARLVHITCAIVVQLTLRGGVRGTGAHPHGAIKVAAASRDFVVKPPSLLTGPRHRRHHYRGEQGHLLPHNPCCATMPLASVFASSFDPILAVANAFDAIRVPFEPCGSIENVNSILSGDNPT